MRIVHLCSSGRVGGIETSVLAMLRSLQATDPSSHLVAIAPERGDFVDRVARLGCEAVVLPFPLPLAHFGEASATRPTALAGAAGGALLYGVRLHRALRILAPDVVHAHGFKMQALARWAAPGRARLIWHAHDYVSRRRISRRVLQSCVSRCAAVIATSESVADDVRRSVRPRVPIVVVRNGIDVERFAPDGDRVDLDRLAALPRPEAGTVRVGLPATFARWKGHDLFFRALSRIPSHLPWRAYVIGGAVYQTRGSQWSLGELRNMVGELGLTARVGFTGLVDDMPAALRALDIVVHASTLPEPFGMTIAEAMSCGRAAVVALAGGAAEIVHDGVDAIGYTRADEGGLAHALGSLIADSAFRARLGKAAREAAIAAFDARRLGPELSRVYRADASA